MGKMVGLVVILVALAVQFRGEVRQALGLPAQVPAAPVDSAPPGAEAALVMYSTPTCGVCDQARRYFARHGIPVDERDVSRNTTYEQQWRDYGGRGVPLFVVDGQVVHGWDRQRLMALLGA